MEKADNLWVKWVHGHYMINGVDFWNHIPQADSSWYWKRLNKLKLYMVNWYRNGIYSLTTNGNYSVMQGYLKLIGDTSKMEIIELVWNKISIPKHRFILWMDVQGRLLTKERMMTMGIQYDNAMCVLCDGTGMEKIVQHIYFLNVGGMHNYGRC